jgi:hypothetical protein
MLYVVLMDPLPGEKTITGKRVLWKEDAEASGPFSTTKNKKQVAFTLSLFTDRIRSIKWSSRCPVELHFISAVWWSSDFLINSRNAMVQI